MGMEMEMVSEVMPVESLVAFGIHFVVAAAVMLLFAVIWLWITPFKEIALIRGGNSAAALSFGGSLVGYAIALAGVIRASSSIWEVVAWSLIALIAQVVGLFIVSRLMHGVTQHIDKGENASGIF